MSNEWWDEQAARRKETTAAWGELAADIEPVFRDGDKIRIHCPECRHLGTHLGTCSWSQMRSGRVWTFIAYAIDFAGDPKEAK